MALSNCAAKRIGETTTTDSLVLGDDLLFKFGLLTDIQHADKVRLQRCLRPILLCYGLQTAAAASLLLLSSAIQQIPCM
jgi:hypothetical protein